MFDFVFLGTKLPQQNSFLVLSPICLFLKIAISEPLIAPRSTYLVYLKWNFKNVIIIIVIFLVTFIFLFVLYLEIWS